MRPTLVQMVEHIVPASAESVDAPKATSTEPGELFPLTFAQQRLWFMDQLESHSAAYNIPIGMRMQGTLQREALERALNDVVARHDALRAYFENVDGVPAQRIRPRWNGPSWCTICAIWHPSSAKRRHKR